MRTSAPGDRPDTAPRGSRTAVNRPQPGNHNERPALITTAQSKRTDGREADFVIVGGGVHGCAAAFELGQQGADVVLIERGQIASGASGGPGKRGVRANLRDPRELPLMRLAYDIWPALDKTLGRPTGYERIGSLELIEAATADDPSAWSQLQARIEVQNAHGIKTELLDRQAMLQLQPGLSPLVRAAVYCPLDGVADHTATTRAYAAAAAAAGVDVREEMEATAVSRRGDVTLIETTNGASFAGRKAVLILANAHAPQILRGSFGLRLPTWTVAPQVSVMRTVQPVPTRHLIGHVSRKLAAKAVGADQIMLSGGRRGTWDSASDTGIPDPNVPGDNLADGVAVFPQLEGASLVKTDATRPESCAADDIPIIDRVPGARDVFFATGWSGHGFAIAPAVAKFLASWVTTGSRPTELAPFGLHRLGV
jgi:sarcosine oxidase, subunit beta